MPLVQTRGAASAQGFGEFAQAAVAANYIEDVFSTYLYTGTGAALTITNGIDLSTKGGLVWIKDRVATPPHLLIDTIRGGNKFVSSNTTTAQTTESIISAFNTTGFSLTADTVVGDWNWSGDTFASWTFRKQPKFFDVVTYTGTGSNTTIAHSLGSVPACIMVKRTDTTGAWQVYHRSLANTEYLVLNTTAAKATGATRWNSTTPTSSVFSLGTDATVNASGGTYVAYIFAHDAGGFGLTGTDNVISCGTFTTDTNGDATVNLGYEPQWVMTKVVSDISNWVINDNMRGMPASQTTQYLRANTSNAETTSIYFSTQPTPTGFKTNSYNNTPSLTMIYIAIRRPMKVPTSGTSVFGLSARTGTGADATVTGGQTDDTVLIKNRGATQGTLFASRLTGTNYVLSSSDAAQVAAGATILQGSPWDVMDGVKVGTTSAITNASSNTFINYLFKRAPSFHDVVCYTGDGTNGRSITHNLTVAPELIIVKERSNIDDWAVYSATYGRDYYAFLNFNYDFLSFNTADFWGTSGPTTTAFGVSNNSSINQSARTYIAYLFATCAGVSKVGSYTGTGTTLQVNCGFTSGARFVMIKRGDSSGDWYVWDTARGIVAGNDQYFLLNTTAAEVTNTDYIDTYSAGFEISSTAPAAINANGGTYIFLAIA